TVSVSMFREQMRFLSVQHIPVVSMADALAALDGKGNLPERAVVVTIDDGYETALTKAWPVLHHFRFPFTLFVYPEAIGRHGSALTWDQLRFLQRHGVDIESHSLTHPLLTHPGRAMSRLEYAAWLDHELADSKKRLEDELHQPVTVIAYPYGGYDERVVERTRKAGYIAALTCDDGDVTRFTDRLHLNRRLVFHRTTLKKYANYFDGRPLIVSDLEPRDGERVSLPPERISARIINWKSILPDSVSVMVDKLGRRPLHGIFDPATGRLTIPLPPNHHHGYFFVSLTARDREVPAIWHETTWLFIVKRNASKN
ncbi:MAG TPA: polysaccharide deacetylase family protein, partial [Elusimicrobiota bacterium]|nr:polysaccharide deacetylase family protein [Elusimicrobiota bacterium]